ncbi:Uma2 family endonuclease [Roseofilum sp. Guam]|uniref:Uma2 family endonuclease n=1 Tax=Roseofilum sp. Guam TaxID=2821502 RepID=UPI001B2440FE|nr:Uma2 family endonuclease [Roseofilum sp. Guam]MBP0026869.1 Uma2 family endonuclease [Roseofilum sp. Guam]
MTDVLTENLSLEKFLELPNLEHSPPWEYVAGNAIQKPMPKFRHAILQKRLLAAIDQASDRYLTLPELRCTFASRSIVPDIVVLSWDKIQLNNEGEPEDNFTQAPDWCIEILSPDQSTNRVIDNILHCLHHGSQLGWLVDPNDYSILILTPQQEIQVCRGHDSLQVLSDIDLQLTAQDVFSWLKLGQKE